LGVDYKDGDEDYYKNDWRGLQNGNLEDGEELVCVCWLLMHQQDKLLLDNAVERIDTLVDIAVQACDLLQRQNLDLVDEQNAECHDCPQVSQELVLCLLKQLL